MAYHPKPLRCLSNLQIILGSISFFLGITSAVLQTDFTSSMGFGIWVGVWIIITGLLGYFGSRERQVPSKCLLGTFMGFTITACQFAVAMLINYSFALAGLEDCIREIREPHYYSPLSDCYDIPGYSPGHTNLSRLKAGIGIGSVLLIIAVLEIALGLASSIYCCTAICPCCNGPSRVQGTQPVVFVQPTTMGQVSTAGGRMAVISGVPPSTANVVQSQEGQFIVQGPVQPHKEQEAPPAYN